MKRLTGRRIFWGVACGSGLYLTSPLHLGLRRTEAMGVEESGNYAFCDMHTDSALTFLTDTNQTLVSFTGLSFKLSFYPSIKLSSWFVHSKHSLIKLHFRIPAPKNETVSSFYSPSCRSKPVRLSFICKTQKEKFWRMFTLLSSLWPKEKKVP